MKSYTDIEQSKKLAEFLPIESADMEYMFLKRDGSMVNIVPFIKDGSEESDCSYNFVPCWSLAALLDILPETIEDEWGEYELKINMIYKKPQYIRLGDCHHSNFPSWDWNNEELLDNIVKSIIWLNNNNYLQNEKLH